MERNLSSMPKQSLEHGKQRKTYGGINQSLLPCPHSDKELGSSRGLISHFRTKLMLQQKEIVIFAM